jgi:hypothetical protein
MAEKKNPRFEDDEFVGTEHNPKDCVGCANLIDEPRKGVCKAYAVMKPYSVYFEGQLCPQKIVSEKK